MVHPLSLVVRSATSLQSQAIGDCFPAVIGAGEIFINLGLVYKAQPASTCLGSSIERESWFSFEGGDVCLIFVRN